MDFDDTPGRSGVSRGGARSGSRAHAEPKRGAFETWQSRYPGREGDGLERAQAFQRSKAEAGFAALHWPAEWGGRALPPIYQVIYSQEESRFLVPRGYFEIGLGMCMPTLFAYATEEQKQRYAPAALARRGGLVPALLRARRRLRPGRPAHARRAGRRRLGRSTARRSGPRARTGPTGPSWSRAATPRRPSTRASPSSSSSMKSPGIETRRIKQISGASNFNEVYFTDVRIPDTQRLGAVGAGWGVAITTLMNERLASGDLRGPDFEEIFGLARAIAARGRPRHRQRGRARAARRLLREDAGRAAHALPHHDRALARGDAGPGELHRQARQRAQGAGDRLVRAWISSTWAAWSWTRTLAPLRAAFQESLLSSPGGRIAARHRRDPAQHHRRARARPAPGRARGPRSALRPAPDR